MYDEDYPDRKLNVLIAGGSSGLGLKLYENFCEKWNLDGLGMFARNIDVLEFDKYRSPLKHTTPLIEMVDATDVDAVDDYFSEYEEEFGSVTHLVCTLGVYGPLKPFVDCDVEEWMAGVENNLFGPAIVAHRALRGMIDKKFGKIVFLSGGGATKPIPGAASYCAGKTGLVRFAEALAHEVIDYDIDVNCVAPGLMPTRFVDQALAAGHDHALYNDAIAMKISNPDNDYFAAPIKMIHNLLMDGDGMTGNLVSSIWDDFFALPKGLSDRYSLRRTV